MKIEEFDEQLIRERLSCYVWESIDAEMRRVKVGAKINNLLELVEKTAVAKCDVQSRLDRFGFKYDCAQIEKDYANDKIERLRAKVAAA